MNALAAPLFVLFVALLAGCSVVQAELLPFLLTEEVEAGPVLAVQPSQAVPPAGEAGPAP